MNKRLRHRSKGRWSYSLPPTPLPITLLGQGRLFKTTKDGLCDYAVTHFDQRGQQLAFSTFLKTEIGLLKRHLDLISGHFPVPSALAVPYHCLAS